MTQIYLVSFEDKETGITVSNKAFTNLQKAKNYQRYWNAKILNESEKWNLETRLKTYEICTINYLDWAIEEEMKALPY